MSISSKTSKRELKKILKLTSLPTAPFKESNVLRLCKERLSTAKHPHFIDQYGNLIVGATSTSDLIKRIKKLKNPAPFFIAHTDHPGFHITNKIDQHHYEWKWFGGSPTQKIINTTVYLADHHGEWGQGKIVSANLNQAKTALSHGKLKVTQMNRRSKEAYTSWFGAWRFSKPAWIKQKILYTQAADDLMGVSLILSLAESASMKKTKPFFAILSRAEEVGFIGSIAFFLKSGISIEVFKKTVAVSLETSRVLPGVEHGKGPIIRLGDRRFVFSSGETQKLNKIAEKYLPGKYQKRVMDGGACEGSVTRALEIPTIALTLPLGNYHNQRFEGGPESSKTLLSPAPEFIHLDDYADALVLCRKIIENSNEFSQPFSEFHQTMEELFGRFKKYL